jgi:three-Cys-motif partner protein
VYLDAFAGERSGLDRLTGEEFPGSARIAREAGAGAGITTFRYVELGQRAAEVKQSLRADYPGRDIKVYQGDCNTTILQALAELRALIWAPTFAFLDPDGMELAWDTIVALADHKRGYRSAASAKPEYKVELLDALSPPLASCARRRDPGATVRARRSRNRHVPAAIAA